MRLFGVLTTNNFQKKSSKEGEIVSLAIITRFKTINFFSSVCFIAGNLHLQLYTHEILESQSDFILHSFEARGQKSLQNISNALLLVGRVTKKNVTSIA